jgi:hypothetical protein
MPLCPPKLPYEVTCRRTRAAAVGSRRQTSYIGYMRWNYKISNIGGYHFEYYRITGSDSIKILRTAVSEVEKTTRFVNSRRVNYIEGDNYD